MRRLAVVVLSVGTFVVGSSTVVLGQPAKSLHIAAATGDVAQLKRHIDNKADLNAPDEHGNFPIKLAVDSYNVEVLTMLLQAGANPNVKDSTGGTPLMAACLSCQKDMVDALLAGKANPAAKDATGLTALHCAAMMGQVEIAESLVKAGADLNAKDKNGNTPIMIAQQRGAAEVVQLLQQHGAALPVIEDPYGMGGAASQAATVTASTSRRPEGFEIDPNVIARQLKEMPSLEAPLKVIDANSQSEQRAWIARRADNRTLLLRAVQKQFEDEMAFVKKVASEEKAAKTVKATDDLVDARKKRYELIGQQLREQVRQSRLESRETMSTTTTGRGGRGGMATRSTSTLRGRAAGGATGQDPYGTTAQPRTPRRTTLGAEAVEERIDADTQAQIQAWLGADADNKAALLQSVSDLDVTEYAVLHELAEEEKAAKTQVAIMALLMLREERIAKIRERWAEDDERTQRMQERAGANGMQDMQQGPGQGTQRGTRRGGR
ncbi:MAG TPA: ankyrin repeat domain-containing protein [Sedimentisphaerales bacterium]|nr:ankyrin repeat domain-containing protein [Sedimentisphaerales bacterium]